MSVTVIQALKNEESRLQAAIEALPQYQQLAAVRKAIRDLEPVYVVEVSATLKANATFVATGAASFGSSVNHSAGSQREIPPESMSSIARRLAISTMEQTGRRLRSSEIVELLVARGVNVTGKKPQATIASMLSSDKRLENKKDERGVGYGLAEWSLPRVTTSADLHAMGVLAPEGRIRGESDSGP